ncbi:MAG TPA: hypothetical protein VEL31_20735 [Ktedonobacteraceae bacterium]|nr:hypothetical protein [Ktedonobacteraceae bacterium]
MKALQKQLEQREKSELIAMIQQMLRQEPEVQWLLTTPLPTSSQPKLSLDSEVYRQQVLAAMEMGNQLRKYKRHEVQRRLLAIKTFADAFANQQQYTAALTIYEALVTQVIAHYNTYPDESIAFNVILQGCVDGLDTCFAGEEDDQHIRLLVLQALFALYRFFTDQSMDLDEDIPGLLVGNTTMQEREAIAGWVRDALSVSKEAKWGVASTHRHYAILLTKLERGPENDAYPHTD